MSDQTRPVRSPPEEFQSLMDRPIGELVELYDVDPDQIERWRLFVEQEAQSDD